MKISNIVIFIFIFSIGPSAGNLSTHFNGVFDLKSNKLILKLWNTNLQNVDKIHQDLGLEGDDSPEFFSTNNPYYPQYKKSFSQKAVISWDKNPIKKSSVCAVKFRDELKKEYELKTFSSKSAAERANYIITHYGRCGMCSSLKDLAIYMAKPDLATPSKKCTKKLSISSIKNCYREKIGFSESCSEQWASNPEPRRKRCWKECLKHYGVIKLLFSNLEGPNNDESGKLNICLACDEKKSGPGFKYAAGRTRRGSGIISAIKRDATELIKIDHYNYFR